MSPPPPRYGPAEEEPGEGSPHRVDPDYPTGSPTLSDDERTPGNQRGAAPDFPSDLSAESLIHREPTSPRGGWRRTLFALTKGHLNPGDSKTESRRQELAAAIRTGAVPGSRHSVAVLGAHQDVGTSTTVLGLGTLLAGKRRDRVAAVDADPGGDPLSDRGQLHVQAQRPLGDLLRAPEPVLRYSQLSEFMAQDVSGLDLLPSHRDDTAGAPLTADAYRRIADAVERFYSLLVVDAGSAVNRPAVPAILQRCDQLVIVAHPSHEGANRAATALDDVGDLGFAELAASAVVVLGRAPGGQRSKLDDLQRQLGQRCKRALRVHRDGTLGPRNAVTPDQMGAKAQFEYLELAAEITRAFDDRT